MMQYPTLSGIMDRSAPPSHIYPKYLPLSLLRIFPSSNSVKDNPRTGVSLLYLFASFCPQFFQDGAQDRDRFCESFLPSCVD
jgi:hypothetical protein